MVIVRIPEVGSLYVALKVEPWNFVR